MEFLGWGGPGSAGPTKDNEAPEKIISALHYYLDHTMTQWKSIWNERNNLIISSHDVSDGGLAIALAESCILSDKGASINLIADERIDSLLFSEGGSRIIFSISHMKKNEWLKFVSEESKNFTDSIYVTKIGNVSQDKLKIKFLDNILCDLKISTLTDKFNNGILNNF